MKASPQKIAKRYALALFDLAEQKKHVDHVYEDMAAALESIHVLAKQKVDPLTAQFLEFLVQKGRLGLLTVIAQEFENLYFEYKEILKVKIISAQELNNDQIKSIASRLKARFNKTIQHDLEIDPRLIGGFKVQVGDTIYDYSIQTQLEKFKNQILSI